MRRNLPICALIAALIAPLPAPAESTAKTTPEGYYASGWPIALAEAACDGDEGCLTRLSNCGPRDESCGDGVAMCDWARDGVRVTLAPCLTDSSEVGAGRAVTAHLPGHPPMELLYGVDGSGTLNGIEGQHALGCINVPTGETFCIRPLLSAADFAPWAPNDNIKESSE